MLRALKRTLYYWSKNYDEICEPSQSGNQSIRLPIKNNGRDVADLDVQYDDPKSMHFNIISANGGKIIEIIRYKKSTNNSHDNERTHTLHVIPEDDNLTESLGRIITLESLR